MEQLIKSPLLPEALVTNCNVDTCKVTSTIDMTTVQLLKHCDSLRVDRPYKATEDYYVTLIHHTHRHTDTHKQTQTDRQTDRQTYTTHTETDRYTRMHTTHTE